MSLLHCLLEITSLTLKSLESLNINKFELKNENKILKKFQFLKNFIILIYFKRCKNLETLKGRPKNHTNTSWAPEKTSTPVFFFCNFSFNSLCELVKFIREFIFNCLAETLLFCFAKEYGEVQCIRSHLV